VQTLVRVEPNGRPLALAGDALLCGFYVNELLLRLLGRQDPHEALFLFYQVALSELACGNDLGTTLRRFELRLLAEIGYGPVLDREAHGERPVDAEQRYVYTEEGGLMRAAAPESEDTISGRTLLRLVTGAPLAGAEAREARLLARRLLAPHLGDRPLRSRTLFGARGKR
jgi:DNA repair protein RecO (recombination protein O)